LRLKTVSWFLLFLCTRELYHRGDEEGGYGDMVPTKVWVEMADCEVHRLHKQPIFCWSIIEGLAEVLQERAGRRVHGGCVAGTDGLNVLSVSGM
jgi:hypothetical protein